MAKGREVAYPKNGAHGGQSSDSISDDVCYRYTDSNEIEIDKGEVEPVSDVRGQVPSDKPKWGYRHVTHPAGCLVTVDPRTCLIQSIYLQQRATRNVRRTSTSR